MLSMVLVWLINPAVVLKAFQIDFTPEVRDRFLLAAGVAVAVNLLLMLITWGYGKLLKLDAVERASVMYANAGNLVIPLVSAILGGDWVIYASAFMCVQLAFLWTHGQAQIGGSSGISWKKSLLNANQIAIILGGVMLPTGFRLPPVIQNVCGQLGGTIGLLMVQLAKLAGAGTVIVSEPQKAKHALAEKAGADYCISPEETTPFELMAEKTYRKSACPSNASAVRKPCGTP